MKSFMKNLLCSIFVFILSVLFNSLIYYVLYGITYFFLEPEELSWDLFLYIDAETMSDIVFHVVFIALQIASLVLWFKLIGRVIAYKKKNININTVTIISFVLMTISSVIFVCYLFYDISDFILISNTFFIFMNLLTLSDSNEVFGISLFILYEIENAIKVLCVYKGYKKYISKRNAEKNH